MASSTRCASGWTWTVSSTAWRTGWLRDRLDSHIRGRPFHSQSAERAVNASVRTAVQYDSCGSELPTFILTSLIHVFRELQRQAGAFALRLRAEDAVAVVAESDKAATAAEVHAAAAACVRRAAELAQLTAAELAALGEAAEAEAGGAATATALPTRASMR